MLYASIPETPKYGGGVFSLEPPTASGSWTGNILRVFDAARGGAMPLGLAIDKSGVMYGTALYRGTVDLGVVFTVTSSGTERFLHSFTGSPNDGSRPEWGPLLTPFGMLGTTYAGGSGTLCGNQGWGMVYLLVPPTVPDGTWSYQLLHSFNSSDGAGPQGSLVIDYGTI